MLQEINLKTILVGLNLQGKKYQNKQSILGFIKKRKKHAIEYLSLDCQHPCWNSSCDNFMYMYILGQTMLDYI